MVHNFNPLTKSTVSVWKHNTFSASEKFLTNQICWLMIIVLFDHKGIIYQHSVPPKTIMNGEYYVSVLKILHQHISRKRQELIGNWILHHDNARPHVITSVSNCIIKIMPNLFYSSDLALWDFWLLLILKEKLRGRKFNTVSEVFSAVLSSLKKYPKISFSTYFENID